MEELCMRQSIYEYMYNIVLTSFLSSMQCYRDMRASEVSYFDIQISYFRFLIMFLANYCVCSSFFQVIALKRNIKP